MCFYFFLLFITFMRTYLISTTSYQVSKLLTFVVVQIVLYNFYLPFYKTCQGFCKWNYLHHIFIILTHNISTLMKIGMIWFMFLTTNTKIIIVILYFNLRFGLPYSVTIRADVDTWFPWSSSFLSQRFEHCNNYLSITSALLIDIDRVSITFIWKIVFEPTNKLTNGGKNLRCDVR